MGKRRQSRELAVQFLYGYDLNRKDLAEALSDFRETPGPNDEVKDFAEELINGVLENLDHLDRVIGEHAKNWKLSRIALVDKNVLRLALYELYFRPDIPPLVTINEAVDIAKRFSTDQSGRFVNGILDQVRQEVEGLIEKAESGDVDGDEVPKST